MEDAVLIRSGSPIRPSAGARFAFEAGWNAHRQAIAADRLTRAEDAAKQRIEAVEEFVERAEMAIVDVPALDTGGIRFSDAIVALRSVAEEMQR